MQEPIYFSLIKPDCSIETGGQASGVDIGRYVVGLELSKEC